MKTNDVRIIRELAGRVAAVAALDVQEQKRGLWRRLNGLDPVRPMVMMDQICWNELAGCAALALQCGDAECRQYEQQLRRTLYQWEHFPVDMVVEPFLDVPMAVINTRFGMQIQEDTVVGDPTNSVVAHKYKNQFRSEEDIEKIQMATVHHDEAETARRLALAHELFDGLLEVRLAGYDPGYMTLWDPLSMWMGVENAFYALVDTPELIHRILARMTDSVLDMLDQLESKGLLCGPQQMIHCTAAYTDVLPAPGFDPARPRVKDLWMFGMAQMFSTVSPDMFKEFEIDYARRICERFGMVYYGCCEPLDGKMNEVRMLPNVRKISMSPWVDQERGAREIGGDYVFSRKPSPALIATDVFHPAAVREDLEATRRICEKHGCGLELILKDVSTIRYEPGRLDKWASVAMEVVGAR